MIDAFIKNCREENGLSQAEESRLREFFRCLSHDYLQIFYHSKVWSFSKYRGIVTYKFPTDMWILQEIIVETQPEVIIESGCMDGGTTLFYADLLDHYKKGLVIGIDLQINGHMPEHPRIKWINGDCLSTDVVNEVSSMIQSGDNVMVDLDSNHRKDHVLKELNLYSPFVTIGNYLIVEDTIISGHPVQVKDRDKKNVNPGPYEAVMEFLKMNGHFAIDRDRERFMLTTNTDGFLRRVS